MDGDILFGAWVRRRRRALDLSQEALARQIGCARITIQKIEAGERRPSREFATVLAERLAIPLGERGSFMRAARTGFLDTAPTADHVAALAPSHSTRSALPVLLTPFIGRAEEQRALKSVLLLPDRLDRLPDADRFVQLVRLGQHHACVHDSPP